MGPVRLLPLPVGGHYIAIRSPHVAAILKPCRVNGPACTPLVWSGSRNTHSPHTVALPDLTDFACCSYKD